MSKIKLMTDEEILEKAIGKAEKLILLEFNVLEEIAFLERMEGEIEELKTNLSSRDLKKPL